MNIIKKIVINGNSGFCCANGIWNDKIMVTENGISYVCIHELESDENRNVEWYFETKSKEQVELYKKLSAVINEMHYEMTEGAINDGTQIALEVCYDDENVRKLNSVYRIYLKKIFDIIEMMIPEGKEMPLMMD